MMYLVDTNVISELRKAHKAEPRVVEWARNREPQCMYLSVISVLEIRMGILSVQRRDLTQGNILQEWFIKKVIPAFSGRILNVDMDVAMRCAELHVPDPRSDRDALIAATALTHKMSVVTRNCKDFEPMGVPIINPSTGVIPIEVSTGTGSPHARRNGCRACFQRCTDWQYHMGIPESLPVYPRH